MCTVDTTKTMIKQPHRSNTPRDGSLYDAALHGKFKKVLERVKTHPEEARIRNSFGYLPLHWLAASQWKSVQPTESAQNDHFDAVVAVFRAYPEAIGYENDMGRTPLNYAVEYGASEAVVEFLQNPTMYFSEKNEYENLDNYDASNKDKLTCINSSQPLKAKKGIKGGKLKKSLTLENDLAKLIRRVDVKLSLMESATLEENKQVEKERLARLQKFNQVEITCNELHREFIKNRVSLGNEKDGEVISGMIKGLSGILDEMRRDQLEADIERRRLRKQLDLQIQGLQYDMKRAADFQFKFIKEDEDERREKTKTMRLEVERALQDKILKSKRRLSGLSDCTFSTALTGDVVSECAISSKTVPM